MEVFSPDTSRGGEAGLVGTRCQRCEHLSLGRRAACPKCYNTEVDSVCIGRRAVLRYFTTVHQDTEEFTAPYVVGLVEAEQGVRFFAPIRAESSKLHRGQELAFQVTEYRDGRPGFTYVPAEGEEP